MGVENFWRQLKHNYLHNYARPRLDHLVWILIYNVTPSYVARMETLEDGYRLGRLKQLTTYQHRFKESWIKLEDKPMSENMYNTNVSSWTCNCGSQKYHRHHLCKHLVHAVGRPDKSFWRNVTRRRVAPLYRHPLLIPKNSTRISGNAPNEYIEPDGAITDGDDRVWSGDPTRLDNRNGWKALVENPSTRTNGTQLAGSNLASRKRTHEDPNPINQASESDPPEAKRPCTDSEIIDLTPTSPPREEYPFERAEVSDASGFDYGSEDELEVSNFFLLSARNLAYLFSLTSSVKTLNRLLRI